MEPTWKGCVVPPEGWWCSREPGHDGPCAARPITRSVAWAKLNRILDENGGQSTPEYLAAWAEFEAIVRSGTEAETGDTHA